MRLQKALLILIVWLVSFQIGFGQERPQAELIDEFGELCSEGILARSDNFLTKVQNDPTAKGYLIFYGSNSLEGRNLTYFNVLKNHPRMRNFDPQRITVLRGANRSEINAQFWVVPQSASPPKVEEFNEEKIISAILFDKNWANFHKSYDGKLKIYDESFFIDWGCGISPNVKDFSVKLISNPELTGYLIVYTKFGKGAQRSKRIADFAVKDLIKNHKVPRSRLKAIYGGNRQEPEIEFWFVPKNDNPPTPTPDKKRK